MPLMPTRLESHLLSAADIMRGKMEALEFRECIFAMLFLKHCSDVFEEPLGQVINEVVAKGNSPHKADGDAESRFSYKSTFHLPPASGWGYLVKQAHKNVGDFLNEALGGPEQGNTKLQDVVAHIDFNRKVGQSGLADIKLRGLLQHTSRDAL